ncbi:hypothetical protein BJX66DRAFT_350217 [Aspergillus keveii]|uniref:Short chain dehydrogenase n=1 Tax=Aspergillus keveii TaxID=714993 RepID=A0ABR4GNN1_9EURO
MPSFVITGASRGLGWTFLSNISSNPKNTIIAIVRNKPATERRVAEELQGRSNIHVLYGDLTSYQSLQAAATDTEKITGGDLDYLIANAAFLSTWDQFDPIGDLGKDPVALEENLLLNFKTNTIAQIHLFNIFTPLILRGAVKKVIAISTGHADIDLVTNHDLSNAPSYAISKVALNMAVAKFSAQYRSDGVLFMAICPGVVDTGLFNEFTEEQLAGVARMIDKFRELAPTFEGPKTPEESVKAMLAVIENATVEKNAGGFLSHKGNRTWF